MKFVYGVVAATAIAISSFIAGSYNWNLDQDHFPCQEDEVLGYSPDNRDKVICIHIDTLRS